MEEKEGTEAGVRGGEEEEREEEPEPVSKEEKTESSEPAAEAETSAPAKTDEEGTGSEPPEPESDEGEKETEPPEPESDEGETEAVPPEPGPDEGETETAPPEPAEKAASDAETSPEGSRRPWMRTLDPGLLICLLLLLMQVIFGVVLCTEILQLNLLPVRYTVLIAAAIVLMTGIEGGLAALRQKPTYITAGIFALCFTACIAVGCVYAQRTAETLEAISVKNIQTEFDELLVVVLENSGIQTLEELDGCSVGIQETMDRENTDRVLESLSEETEVSVTVQEYNGIYDMIEGLYKGRDDAVIFNEAYRDLITDSFQTFEDDIRVLNTFTYTTTVDVAEEEEEDEMNIRENFRLEEEPFIVYFSGIDTYGEIATKSRSDVNILAVVHPVTKEILLVTTPRDYYVDLPLEENCMDKLTHAGIYGIDCSIQTLENLYDIRIDYYLRVNFTGFMGIVDALGGVNVYSEQEFTSEVGNYDFKVGYNEVNGKMALGFVRERHSFGDGDAQRARNQMAMIQAILRKATSPAILSGYLAVLDSIEDTINTNMDSDDIGTLVKLQLTDDANWHLTTYSTRGTGSRRSTYSMGSMQLYVEIQDDESVEEAKQLIQDVWDGRAPGEGREEESTEDSSEESTEDEES